MPSYHLCADFRIPPPPDGQLRLGSILENLDEDGVQFPLNHLQVVPVADDAIYPQSGAFVERGFTRSMSELRSVSGDIWSKIFSVAQLSARFRRSHGMGDFLTVKELHTQTFIPDEEYMKKSLEAPRVKGYVTARKFEAPVYMVTGIMSAHGASWSSERSRSTAFSAETGMVPSTEASVGGTVGYSRSIENTTGVENSNAFILGIRIRKIWWKKGLRRVSDKVIGRVLESQACRKDAEGQAVELHVRDEFEMDDSEIPDGDNLRFVTISDKSNTDATIWILH